MFVRNDLLFFGLGILVPVCASVLVFLFVDAPPLRAIELFFEGSFGSSQRLGDTLMIWVPLLLASSALIITFSAGMWNIGIEGQIIAGAVAASFVAREFEASTPVVLTAMIVAGLIGGMIWGGLAGLLRVRGGVNEIFGGLGLNFVATGLVVYLIMGPWSRRGIASTGGTEPFRPQAWFPTLDGLRVSPLAVLLAIGVLILVLWFLSQTSYGLRLRATGKNPLAASRFGIRTDAYLLLSFLLAGGVAGLAGVTQAAAVYHRLVPSISGGYGFLAILIVLLAGFRGQWILPIALFFAAVSMASFQWQLQLGLHSSLGGVIQGILVLSVLLLSGYRAISYMRKPISEEGDA